MADENVNTTADTTEPPLGEGAPGAPLAGTGGAGPEGGPVPGDPSSEPVATAQQSHVSGRVGPPTIPQDSDAPWHAPDGVEQIPPGTVLPADTVPEGGALTVPPVPAELGAGPYGGDTPADESPSTVHATKPGEGGATAEELPPNTPLPGDAASASSIGGGNTTTATPSPSPTSPTEEPASPSSESDEPSPSTTGHGTTTGTTSKATTTKSKS